MPKLTKKRHQAGIAMEPNPSAPGAGKIEEDNEHPIPVGASLYWEIPGDIPGVTRRRMPLPADQPLPDRPGMDSTPGHPVNEDTANSPGHVTHISTHREPGTTPDNKVSSEPDKKTSETVESDDSLAGSSTGSTNTPLSRTGVDNVKLAAPVESPIAPNVSRPPGSEATPQNPETGRPVSRADASGAPAPNTGENAPLEKPGRTAVASLGASGPGEGALESNVAGNNTAALGRQNSALQPDTGYLQVKGHPQPPAREKAKKNGVLPALFLLLLFLLLGGMGYDYLFDNETTRQVAVTQIESPPPATASPEAVTIKAEPAQETPVKVIEITVDALDQHAISGLRMITHVVVKGDTLWDIAETYLNNPWRYPELAERSRIENPDLIYPGDRVQIHIRIAESES